LWQPSDTLRLTLVGDYSRGREESVSQHLLTIDMAAPLLNLWNALVGGPSGQPMTPALLLDNSYDTLQTGRSINDMDVWGVSLTADWRLGQTNLKSITAYRDGDVDFSRDGDNSPAPYVETFNDTDQHQFSQEFSTHEARSCGLLRAGTVAALHQLSNSTAFLHRDRS